MILPEDLGEMLCGLNLILCNPFLDYSFSSVSANAIMMNRQKIGETLSPCFNPALKVMDMSIFPSISLTLLSVYILLVAEHFLGGKPYFFNISTINFWLEVSMLLQGQQTLQMLVDCDYIESATLS